MKEYYLLNRENLIYKYIKVIFHISICLFILLLCSNKASANTIIETGVTLSAYKIAGPYFRIAIVACEPFLGLLIIGICENLNSFFGNPLDIQTTMLGNHIILIIVFIMYILTKLLKSNSGTKIFGMITLGEIEKKLGVIFPLILGVINIYMIKKYGIDSQSNSFINNSNSLIVLSIIMSILFVIVCYIIKTFVSCIEVLQLSLSFIPGFSFFCEILQSLLVVFLLWLSSIDMKVCIIISLLIIIISTLLFRKCYKITTYYRKIYLEPFLIKLGLKRSKGPLYNEKVYKKISSFFNTGDKINLIIPVYSLKRNGLFKKYDSFYLICLNNTVYLYKDAFLKKNQKSIAINDFVYIKQNKRFIEFFTVFNKREFILSNYKKPNKNMSFAISNSYKNYYDNILRYSHFTNIK